ncbi:MAG TPA: HAD-IIB family hydrolase [Desulfomonilia bacterium]
MYRKNLDDLCQRTLIFTDLDGSLLNHDDYSFSDAKRALKFIRSKSIPLIFCSSKTRMEIEILQKAAGIRDPFIVENGSAIYIPKDYEIICSKDAQAIGEYRLIMLGLNYMAIRSFVSSISKDYQVKGFGDMSAAEISELSGLSLEQAGMAKMREFTEPFIIGNRKMIPALRASANLRGIAITEGGRFYHFIGSSSNKGLAVGRLRSIYSRTRLREMLTIGIGDSQNDFSILSCVDIPVLIPHPDGSYADIDLPGMIRARYPGSMGWNDAVTSIIERLLENNS